mgnify:CR=1 FL=1
MVRARGLRRSECRPTGRSTWRWRRCGSTSPSEGMWRPVRPQWQRRRHLTGFWRSAGHLMSWRSTAGGLWKATSSTRARSRRTRSWTSCLTRLSSGTNRSSLPLSHAMVQFFALILPWVALAEERMKSEAAQLPVGLDTYHMVGRDPCRRSLPPCVRRKAEAKEEGLDGSEVRPDVGRSLAFSCADV